MSRGYVFNIQRFSTHDGPGIRTTVFLKGCPLLCKWCHNPEGLTPLPQLVLTADHCLRCGFCAAACKDKAITMTEDGVSIDRDRCTVCGACHDACPPQALQLFGKEMSVKEVMAEVEKDRVFYDESGGGVTFSGGEPLLQQNFLKELLQACRQVGIRTAVDTSGYAPWECIAAIAPLTDIFLYDLKSIDSTIHEGLTGVPNTLIIDNLRRLAEVHDNINLRIPIIPGHNDQQDYLLRTGGLSRELGITTVNILPYHNTGSGKFERMGMDYGLLELRPPTTEEMERIALLLRGLSLEVKIGG